METIGKLAEIFRMVFNSPDVVITSATTANDIDGWDSLSHITLINAVELAFRVKFTGKEILTFRNVGEMVQSIDDKLNNP